MTKTFKSVRNALAAAALLSLANSVSANTIFFQDNFESGLGKWFEGSGYITPGNNGNVLAFHGYGSGGDSVTKMVDVPNTGNAALVYISFDYSGGGGYLGINPGSNDWLAGEPPYSGTFGPVLPLIYDNQWRHYEVSLPGDSSHLPARIMLEDFVQASSHGAKFDNIVVADYSGAHVPEAGSSLMLLGAGLTALAAFRRKLS